MYQTFPLIVGFPIGVVFMKGSRLQKDANSIWEEEDDDWNYDLEREESETSGLSAVWKEGCALNMTFCAVGHFLWITWMKTHFGEGFTWGWHMEKSLFEIARAGGKDRDEFKTLLVCTQSSLSDTIVWGFQHGRNAQQEEVIRVSQHVPEISRHVVPSKGTTPTPCARSFDGAHASAVVASLLRSQVRHILHMIPTDEAHSGYLYVLIDPKEGRCFQNVSPKTLFDALCAANAKFTVTREGLLKMFEELVIPLKQDECAMEWVDTANGDAPLLRIEFNNVNRISCIKVARRQSN